MNFSGIDPTVSASLIDLGASLTALTFKGTVTAVHGKIESLKKERNADTIRNAYDEIVNQLLEEREEAIRIAQTFKTELDNVVISDEDIEYLQQTISKVLDAIKALQLSGMFNDNSEEQQEKIKSSITAIDSLKNLISKDVIKTMQLLGFNYKAAIGAPLTELCANAISSLGKSNNKNIKLKK